MKDEGVLDLQSPKVFPDNSFDSVSMIPKSVQADLPAPDFDMASGTFSPYKWLCLFAVRYSWQRCCRQ
jgi:hypothetical protein